MSQRISERIGEWFGVYLDKHGASEKIEWDLGLVPSPDGRTVHVLTVISPSPLLGQSIQTSVVLAGAQQLTEEAAEEVAISCVENLRESKSKALAEAAPPVPV